MTPDNGSALVTGASRGIGAAVARALAADGWRVGLNYRSDEQGAARVAREIEAEGGSAAPFAGDVSDPATAERLLDELEDRFGPVLVLVNNAGVRDDAVAPQIDDEAWSACSRRTSAAPSGHPSGAAPDDPRPLRADDQHRLGRRPAGQSGTGQLRRLQGRADRAHGTSRPRSRAAA